MNSRTNIIILACLLIGSMIGVHANPISPDEDKQKVLSLMNTRQMHRVRGNVQLTLAHTLSKGQEGDQPLLYAFNLSGDNGFIIASADDKAEAILGYSDNGQFHPDSIPPALKDWMDCWAAEIAWSQANGYATADATTPAKAKASVARMMRSTWGQNSPFYNQCSFDGTICSVGCVPAAMAQILYYWASVGKDGEYFQGGCKALPAYTTKTYKLSVDALSALSSFSWSNMTDETPRTSSSKKAIAQLMRYCGQSIKADYAEGVTTGSIQTATESFKSNFGYNSEIKVIKASGMTNAQWSDRIYEEMAAGRPVIMCGYHDDIGHVFVCDGYDNYNGKFHFNMGWAGFCDGWYSMSAITVNGIAYNTDKMAVVNINPIKKTSAYALLSSDATTLTFYYDDYRSSRTGTVYDLNTGTTVPGWSGKTTVRNVVFDSSFASYDPTSTYRWLAGMSSLTNVKGLEYINMQQVTNSDQMFYGCSSLKSISLPKNFTAISQQMFLNCTSLESVEIPSSVTSIGEYAFYGCNKLTSVTVDLTNPLTISSTVFSNRKNADLYIPAGYKSLYAKANYWKEFKNMYVFGYAPGDVNHDGFVNVADIMATANNILGNKNVTFYKTEGDLNTDGSVNVSDLMGIVNIAMDDGLK